MKQLNFCKECGDEFTEELPMCCGDYVGQAEDQDGVCIACCPQHKYKNYKQNLFPAGKWTQDQHEYYWEHISVVDHGAS